MRIVVDTNRIIAALIRNGVSRTIIMNDSFEFFTPDFTLTEINKYENDIINKAKITHEELKILREIIFERIEIVSIEEYFSFLETSKELISDSKDTPFVALALSKNVDGIWSNDAHFLKQDKIKIFKTEELFNMFRNYDENYWDF